MIEMAMDTTLVNNDNSVKDTTTATTATEGADATTTTPTPVSEPVPTPTPTPTPTPPPQQQQNNNTSKQQSMKRIYLEKVVLNMGMGKSGDAINVAKKALEQIANGHKPSQRNARDSQRDWGVRKGEPIGVSVTVRGPDARDLLKRLLDARGNVVRGKSFDEFGNYSFGIREHIDIPGVKYDPQIGILGLGVTVSLARPGYSIRKRSKHRASVGRTHAITSSEAQRFMTGEFGVQVE